MNKILLVLVLLCLSHQLSKEEAKEIIGNIDKEDFVKNFNFTEGEANGLVFNVLDLKNNQKSIEVYAK